MTLILSGTDGISDIDGSAATPAIRGTDANTGIFFPAADTIAFSEGGVEAMRIDSSGNVGIGTSSPNTKLTVGTPNTQTVALAGSFSGATPAIATGIGMVTVNSTDTVAVDKGGVLSFTANTTTLSGYTMGFIAGKYETAGAGVYSGYLQFGTSNSAGTIAERMRIDSSGNLLVGKTATGLASSGFEANATGMTASNSGAETANFNRNTSDGTVVIFRRSSTGVGTIGVTTTATSYNTSSDYRLKNSIAPMTGALAKVALLKPCTYKWNVDGSDGQGFIAHELAEVESGCVNGEKDAVDSYGNPIYQGVDTSFLVATLTSAIQEQQALITALTARITALEAK
jgi:hypothetical protein